VWELTGGRLVPVDTRALKALPLSVAGGAEPELADT
jgi:hypothetical protein